MTDIEKQRLEFSQRLKNLLEKKGYAERGMAQRVKREVNLDISDRAINKWLSAESMPDHVNMNKLADFYNVSYDWLANGRGLEKPTLEALRQQIAEIQQPSYNGLSFQDAEVVNLAPTSDENLVPVISWVAAGGWSNVEPVSIEDIAIKWISRPAKLSKRGFALIVKGRSMYPEFKPDDIIFVEPETGFLKLKDGDLVVVSCNDDTEATFKQLVIGETSDDMYLRPLNPEWQEQKMLPVGDCNLVGKVIGKYVEY